MGVVGFQHQLELRCHTISRRRMSSRCMARVNYSPACHLTKAPRGAPRGMRLKARVRGARARNNIPPHSRDQPTEFLWDLEGRF